jgi:hypothetical protein
MSDEYQQAVERARILIQRGGFSPPSYNGKPADQAAWEQVQATRAVAESILALAAALRPEPLEVKVTVDAAEATAAAEAAVRARRINEGRWTR